MFLFIIVFSLQELLILVQRVFAVENSIFARVAKFHSPCEFSQGCEILPPCQSNAIDSSFPNLSVPETPIHFFPIHGTSKVCTHKLLKISLLSLDPSLSPSPFVYIASPFLYITIPSFLLLVNSLSCSKPFPYLL